MHYLAIIALTILLASQATGYFIAKSRTGYMFELKKTPLLIEAVCITYLTYYYLGE